MAGKGRIKDVWREQQILVQRSIIAGVLIAVMTAALIARLAWLQISRISLVVAATVIALIRVLRGTTQASGS